MGQAFILLRYKENIPLWTLHNITLSPDILMIGGAPTEKEGDGKESSEIEGESDPLPDITVPQGVIRVHRLSRAIQTPTFRFLEINYCGRKLWRGEGLF